LTIIRLERPGDVAAIGDILVASFPTDAEQRLVGLLRAAGHLTVSLVAEVDGEVVGHVAFSPVTTSNGIVGVGLAPLAAVMAYRRLGIGGRLVADGLRECEDLGWGWAVVLGDPGYYSRFGFRPAAGFGLDDEYEGGDAFQAIELRAGSLPLDAGRVVYGPEFALFA
jgi:putative acetyltransferase